MPSLTLLAPAKINLGLRVLHKRADGYHEIDSIFVAIDLCDELNISPSGSIEVVCDPPMTDAPEQNLVYLAAKKLHEAARLNNTGAKIVLTKRIPSGAGLGGGSSDAASALMGLNTFWNAHLTSTQLALIAADIGSDVPFFIHNGHLAQVRGRGETVVPLGFHLPWIIVVIHPDIHTSTARAYANLSLRPHPETEENYLVSTLANLIESQPTNSKDFARIGGRNLINDFTETIASQAPVISTISGTLYQNGALFASLTGSGSAVYGLFTTQDEADAAASALADHHTYICRPMKLAVE